VGQSQSRLGSLAAGAGVIVNGQCRMALSLKPAVKKRNRDLRAGENMRRLHFSLFSIIFLGLIGGVTGASAKTNKAGPAPKDPQDQIEVVSHIPVPGGAVTSFVVTQHYSRNYLYAEHEGGKDITLIDVTNTAQPLVFSDISYSSVGGSASLFAVAGTAALITEGPISSPAGAAPQTVRIMDLFGPATSHRGTRIQRRDGHRRKGRLGLIFLANSDGIWLLQQSLALDPEILKEWIRQASSP
jgi:hypothetical protein